MTNKHQVPVLGGLRKVIRTGESATPGTTITEIGDQAVTLAQLAALISAIQAENKNPGTPVAALALGPGLSGGGPVIGVVPIRLQTLPAVIFDVGSDSGGGGTEGFMIPGPAGARGLPGQAVFYIPDDGEEGMMGAPAPITPGPRGLQGPPGFDGADGEDPLFIPGPIGPQGPQGVPGTGGSGSGMGPPGQDGADGEDAMMIPGNPGPTGAPGAQGLPGVSVPGSSGDDGDDAPWIPGQIGPRGASGAQGAPGQDGADGEDAMMIPGNPGATGATGTPGTPGLTGAGVPGFAGEDGEDGLWVCGPRGAQGLQGVQGATGIEGDPGEDALMIPGPGASTAFANPTALVGLAAVNGAAISAMRSDAAPALDISINATWTGAHIFAANTGTPVTVGGVAVTGGLTFAISNTATASGDIARFIVATPSSSFACFAAPTAQATPLITGGPTGAQIVLRNLGGYPLVFGVSNTYAFGLDSSLAVCPAQPTPSAVNATATLTIAQLLTQIITSTSAAVVTATLPTGTLSDAGLMAGLSGINTSFDWSVINTGPSAFTVAAGVAHTLVGSGVVATGTSSRFRSRKTAANTFVTYRIAQ